MAKQNVTKLLDDVQNDADLQKKFDGVVGVDEITRMAGEAGYDFTEEEFRSGSAEYYESRGVELTDEQLEVVAGGAVCSSSIIIIIN